MLVLAQVLSMKARRPGWRSTCLSNQVWRWVRVSGRSCSVACAVFFARQRMAREEVLQGAVTETMASIQQSPTKFGGRDVRGFVQKATDPLMLRLDPAGAMVAAQRSRRDITLPPIQRPPSTDGRSADHKPFRRSTTLAPPATAAAHEYEDRPIGLSTWQLASYPASIMNHRSGTRGSPRDSFRSENALIVCV